MLFKQIYLFHYLSLYIIFHLIRENENKIRILRKPRAPVSKFDENNTVNVYRLTGAHPLISFPSHCLRFLDRHNIICKRFELIL